jgi:glucuronoarabinoxylan endo-1,4-beta-xylanase
LSTGNETANLCQNNPITIETPTDEVIVSMPARSLNTYIFMIQPEETAIRNITPISQSSMFDEKGVYDLSGRKIGLQGRKGLYIENGKKIYINR